MLSRFLALVAVIIAMGGGWWYVYAYRHNLHQVVSPVVLAGLMAVMLWLVNATKNYKRDEGLETLEAAIPPSAKRSIQTLNGTATITFILLGFVIFATGAALILDTVIPAEQAKLYLAGEVALAIGCLIVRFIGHQMWQAQLSRLRHAS